MNVLEIENGAWLRWHCEGRRQDSIELRSRRRRGNAKRALRGGARRPSVVTATSDEVKRGHVPELGSSELGDTVGGLFTARINPRRGIPAVRV